MTNDSQQSSEGWSNPFATRHVRPGAVAFEFPAQESAAAVVQRLKDSEWRGQIVGPHGSGKSTLLQALEPDLKLAGREIHSIALHDGQRRLPQDFLSNAPAGATTILIVDGYEQLGALSRIRLKWRLWRTGCGLLVTTHAPVSGLPVLLSTNTSAELACRLAARLLSPGDETVLPVDVRAACEQQGGDLRAVWFALYDLYELRRRAALSGPSSQAAE